jgi:hypothetical protein
LSPLRAIAILACFAVASGCASIFDGTTQRISVNTNPTGARCTFWRNGGLIGDVAATPGSLVVDKSRQELVIVCDKPGYTPSTYVNRSGLAGMAWANILTAGLTWAVDTTRGADNKYESDVNLSLSPGATVAPMPAAEPPPTAQPVAGGAASRPRTAPPPVPAPAVAVPAAPALVCAAADGSRIRVTGSACPSGWAPAR